MRKNNRNKRYNRQRDIVRNKGSDLSIFVNKDLFCFSTVVIVYHVFI